MLIPHNAATFSPLNGGPPKQGSTHPLIGKPLGQAGECIVIADFNKVNHSKTLLTNHSFT